MNDTAWPDGEPEAAPRRERLSSCGCPGSQPRSGRRWAKSGTGAGGAAATLAMACPVCKPVAVPIFGAAGVLSFLAPYRGVIALAASVLLALPLLLPMGTARACRPTRCVPEAPVLAPEGPSS